MNYHKNSSLTKNSELKLFDSSRSLEGASKAAALAKTVLEESEKQTSKEKVSSEVSKASIKNESSENPDSQPSSKKQVLRPSFSAYIRSCVF